MSMMIARLCCLVACGSVAVLTLYMCGLGYLLQFKVVSIYSPASGYALTLGFWCLLIAMVSLLLAMVTYVFGKLTGATRIEEGK